MSPFGNPAGASMATSRVMAGNFGNSPKPAPRALFNGSLDKRELLLHCRERLETYKIPREFRAVESLAMTATGKVRRAQVSEDPGA